MASSPLANALEEFAQSFNGKGACRDLALGFHSLPWKTVAQTDFDAYLIKHIPLRAGDLVTLIAEHSDGFCEGEANGKRGFFPRLKLSELPEVLSLVKGGNADAQRELGMRYFWGQGGCPKDVQLGLSYYRKAADQGHSMAQYNLGYCYVFGHGVEKKDYTKAVRWYRAAAFAGHSTSQRAMASCYRNGLGGLEKDKKKAFEWYMRAVESGDKDAMFDVGQCYDNGHGVALDAAEAVQWYRKGAAIGHVGSQYNLAVSLRNGTGVPQNREESTEWFRIAALAGDADAQLVMGRDLCKSIGWDAALPWLTLAAEQGLKEARRILESSDGHGGLSKLL